MSQVAKSLNKAIKKTVKDFMSKKMLREIEVDSQKKKLFESGTCSFICSRNNFVKELILDEKEVVYCQKCIHCLFHNQKKNTKVQNVTWAPKRLGIHPIKYRKSKSIN